MFSSKNCIPFFTVIIWGSLYVAGKYVMPDIPALLLLFFRFSISSILLIAIARPKQLQPFEKDDLKELFLVGIGGYYLSNAALLLGIQYSNSSFSSLVNAMNPVFITVFAYLILKETLHKKDILALIATVFGAFLVIGTPNGEISIFGIVCCLFSMLLWSYITIHIKKLTAKYSPLLVTGYGMGIAAILALPTALLFVKINHISVLFSNKLLFPLLYICIICTALSHVAWNYALSISNATHCAAFYPLQPISSMLFGLLLLHEKLNPGFLIGSACILFAMILHAAPQKK